MGLQQSFASLLEPWEPWNDGSFIVHVRPAQQAKYRIGKHGTPITDIIETIDHGDQIHVMSMGEYGAAAILRQLAKQIGPCDVMIGTYNISMQRGWVDDLLMPRRAGLFRTLAILFDSSNQAASADSLRELREDYGASLSAKVGKCHSKVYTASNDDWSVVVESSSNITGKARVEFYVISEDRELLEFHNGWIRSEMNRATEPLCLA